MTEETNGTMFFNGVDATTGTYAFDPIEPEAFSNMLLGVAPDPDQETLKHWVNQYIKSGHYGLKEGHDPKKLDESGWGVIFAHDADPALIDALRPLLDWRKEQAGEYYREYTGGMGGFRPNDTKTTWLGRQGGSVGPADPEKVPYYLMLVGSPERIPYRFQTLLDVQYAVGRIDFDTLEEYAYYAQSVVLAEKQQVRLSRKMSFWGVANPDDPATRMSSEHLVKPLIESLRKDQKGQPWQFESFVDGQATKACITDLLHGKDIPGLLFTASHGVGFPRAHPDQVRHQGALLCQEWPGPRSAGGPIGQDIYFCGDDLSSQANLLGMISFVFACYGAGTPLLDEFAQQAFKDRRVEVAEKPFIAGLPKRMLSLEKGGALAVIGHVERAWGHSFFWGKNRSLTAFESALLSLMNGNPVGNAFEVFNERYAEISTELSDTLDEVQYGLRVDPVELAGKWTATNDSKNYVVLGDPAVRMNVVEGDIPPAQRPSITLSGEPPAAANPEKPVTPPAVTPATVTPPPAVEVVNQRTFEPQEQGVEEASFSLPSTPAGTTSSGTLTEMVRKLAAFISRSVDQAATLEVRTYASEEMGSVSIVNGDPKGAELRAMTVIQLLGDITQVIPVRDGAVDQELWAIHQEMVKQAQASRNELIQSALTAAASLANLRIDR